MRLAMAVSGFVLVHLAAYFLYTATAPYLGSVIGILGLLMFVSGSGQAFAHACKKIWWQEVLLFEGLGVQRTEDRRQKTEDRGQMQLRWCIVLLFSLYEY